MTAKDIAKIKQQLAEYQRSTANFVNNRLYSVEWAHKEHIEEKELSASVMLESKLIDQTNKSLDNVIRESIGKVGQLIIENLLVEYTGRSTEWKNQDRQIVYANSLPDYPKFTTTEELRCLKMQYRECIKEYLTALKDKKKFETDKSIAQAEDKWKSA